MEQNVADGRQEEIQITSRKREEEQLRKVFERMDVRTQPIPTTARSPGASLTYCLCVQVNNDRRVDVSDLKATLRSLNHDVSVSPSHQPVAFY